VVRVLPVASKPSNTTPAVSMRLWHPRAAGLGPMHLEPLALGETRPEPFEVDDHVGGRRRNQLAQEVEADLETSPHDRGARRFVVGEHHRLGEHARTSRRRDPFERSAGRTGKPVVVRKLGVRERIGAVSSCSKLPPGSASKLAMKASVSLLQEVGQLGR